MIVKMDINVKFSYGDQSICNLAFIKAILIKINIEKLNISYKQKEELLKEIINNLEIKEYI